MSAVSSDLLTRLVVAGLSLSVDDAGGLAVEGPEDLVESHIQEIAANRDAILAWLIERKPASDEFRAGLRAHGEWRRAGETCPACGHYGERGPTHVGLSDLHCQACGHTWQVKR